MKRILFTIKPDGSVSADSSGFKGDICIKDTAKALQGLDAKMESQVKKAEYNTVGTTVHENIHCGSE
jgi:hypothetical protein